MEGIEKIALIKEALSSRRQDHCTLVLMESGKITVRRIYDITTQGADGRVSHSEGKKLPIGIIVNTGDRQDEKSFIQAIARSSQSHAPGRLALATWFGMKIAGAFLFGMFAMYLLWTASHAVEIEQYRYGRRP